MNYDIEGYILEEGASSYGSVTGICGGGAYILETSGVMSAGKQKNVVTESYADHGGLRAHVPEQVLREDTEFTLKVLLCSEGDGDMYSKHDALTAALSGKLVWYWDTVRLRKVLLLMTDSVVTEESYKGSIPYLSVTYRFRNVNGYSEPAVADPSNPSQSDFFGYSWSSPQQVSGGVRNKTVTFCMLGEQAGSPMDITDAFPGFSSLGTTAFRNMNQQSYLQRLHAFSAYAIASAEASVPLLKGNVRTVEPGAWSETPV